MIPSSVIQNLSVNILESIFKKTSFDKPDESSFFQLLSQDVFKYSLMKYINLLNIDFKLFKSFWSN
jgi:hypothetical protein